jgi:hypothetical protein
MVRLEEKHLDAVNCLERLTKQLSKEYDPDVASEFIDAIFAIGKNDLMKKEEIDSFIDKYIKIIGKYIK